MKTGIVKDRRYMDHDMGPYHPENPGRIEAVYTMIDTEIRFPYMEIEPHPAEEEEVGLVHSPGYITQIKQTAGRGRVILDPDTSTSPRSYETAMLAVGGLLKTADLIMEGKIQNGFALVRPPGHHAEASHAMGFCIFNNIAVAAEYLVKKHGIKKILIVDWDLHHGNGTQHAFENRKDILYFSAHQFPYYPGSGYWDEVGRAEGEGYTVNVPLRPGKRDEDYLYIFRKILVPIASVFEPEFILVSAGFDNCIGDPLGGMMVSSRGFGAMAEELLSLAEKYSRNRILFTLEGGYSLEGLREGIKQVLYQMSGEGEKPGIEPKASSHLDKELAPVFETHKKYWDLDK
jgi:acetoin utilization deacetylase AcuC-like enzyme